MRILNFGSLNLDYVYQVPHFLTPGETMAASSVAVVPGGKGLNQSIALVRAGADVWHAGTVGAGSDVLTELLASSGVNLTWLKRGEGIQGSAIIQVTPAGENAILLCGGSNREITAQQVRETISHFDCGDWLILQNEVSCLKEMVEEGKKRGMHVVLNPSPFEEKLLEMNIGLIDWLFINEVEGRQMTGITDPDGILNALHSRYPQISTVLTLGKEGAVCDAQGTRIYQPAFEVKAVDTTAAGDTFTGYFIAAYTQGRCLRECMLRATAASAISVSRAGASASIPLAAQVDAMLANASNM
ncbi:MAG: ribokinase [Clostridia bacterium]|nr:ribokinase [Clostridia bacterium]